MASDQVETSWPPNPGDSANLVRRGGRRVVEVVEVRGPYVYIQYTGSRPGERVSWAEWLTATPVERGGA